MKTDKIYISGKMTGDPDYEMKFKCAKADVVTYYRSCVDNAKCSRACPMYDLKYVSICRIHDTLANRRKLEVVNPVDFGYKGHGWLYCIIGCLNHLRKCQYIYMLEDWTESRGARLEHWFAKLWHIRIIYKDKKGGRK